MFAKKFAVTIVCVFLWMSVPSSQARTWTDSKGNQIEAEFLGPVEGDSSRVQLKNRKGKVLKVSLSNLSEADQKYVRSQPEMRSEDAEDAKETEDAKNTEDAVDVTQLTGMDGRGYADIIALQSGGSEKSQKAVTRGLFWISRHQCKDGSWNFNHLLSGGKCNCSGSGALMKATNAATAMAILPFLGCGQTHQEGEYKEEIQRGLAYLRKNIKSDPKIAGGNLCQNEGTMYCHGLASICLAEAYSITKDKTLRAPAQNAINFIINAQDPAGGGWRYAPRQAGDTSVFGWQASALIAGYSGYLKINSNTVQNAMHFLDTVQTDGGAGYGYTTPGKTPTCTAIGLLFRIYFGWKQDSPTLKRGIDYLSARGPSSDPYYNYYATQVMYQYGGDSWTKWNTKMHDQLIHSQAQDESSHEFGSWPMSGGHGTQGGRLYSTSLSVLTLEVYYRHMPVYKNPNSL